MRKTIPAIIVIVSILVILSLPVCAEINHGGSDAGGETGKGSSDWKFTTNGRGVRISIYFVEGKKEEFGNPDVTIYPIGNPTDFAKAGIPSNYTVEEYTKMSVFGYMHWKRTYTPFYADEEPYTYVHPTESVVKSMPEPFEATREQWHQWFEGNNYKNIQEITKLCGEEISSEDFSKGIYRYKGLVLHGTYKIFFEPLISAIVDGNAMFLTLRDAIKYNEKRNNEQGYNNTIVWKLNLMFEYLANPAYLIIDEEEALNMYANSGEYKVEYIRSKYNESCKEIIDEMKPGGRIYNSMGVGVVCKEYKEPAAPVIVEEPEPEVPEIPIASDTEEVTGALKAEDRDKGELYDVDNGIPSTEKLYANVISNEYLKDFDFELVEGSRDYTVKVKRTYYLHYQDWFPNSDDCPSCTGGRVDDPDDPDPAKTISCGNCGGDGLVGGYDWTYDTYDYSATYPITRYYPVFDS